MVGAASTKIVFSVHRQVVYRHHSVAGETDGQRLLALSAMNGALSDAMQDGHGI
jgi:hypothetical protein